MGNWMGWNFGKGADRGQGRYEGEFVIVDVFVLGAAPVEGTFSANIVTALKGGKAETRHVDAATLEALREAAAQAGRNADSHAAARAKHDKWTWSKGGGEGDSFDPTGMGGE